MKTISVLAVVAIILVDVFGPKSSVGGPMTNLLVSFVVMLVVGIHQAWGQGPLGWMVNILLAIIGGVVALGLMGTAMDMTMSAIHFEGKLATSDHPLRYIADVAMPISTVLGSWIAIQAVHRLSSALLGKTV